MHVLYRNLFIAVGTIHNVHVYKGSFRGAIKKLRLIVSHPPKYMYELLLPLHIMRPDHM